MLSVTLGLVVLCAVGLSPSKADGIVYHKTNSCEVHCKKSTDIVILYKTTLYRPSFFVVFMLYNICRHRMRICISTMPMKNILETIIRRHLILH